MTNPTRAPAAPYLVQTDPLVLPLVPDYLRNRAADVQKLDVALTARDFAVLRKVGHNIRGSAGAYGLPPLSDIGAAIEDAAVKQDLAALAAGVESMRQFLQAVKVPR